MSTIQTKYKIIIAAVVVATAFATGRYTTPVKVVTETKTVEVERKQVDQQLDKNQHQVVTKTETKKPDGTEVTVTQTTTDTKTDQDTKTSEQVATKSDTKTETTRSSSTLNLSLMGGVKLDSLSAAPMVYGGSVSRNLIGPVRVGVWGLSNATAGVSLGLDF